jgi:hemolysin III
MRPMQGLAGATVPNAVAGGAPGSSGESAGPGASGGTTRPRPLLRGVSHEIFFFVSLVTGPLLVIAAPTVKAKVCVAIYALTTTTMLGTSALFHRHRWASAAARKRMRRADHSAIFLFIAGTYTAVSLVLSPGWAALVLSLVWAGAIAGIIIRWAWLTAPKWAVALPYVVLGWMAVIALPELVHRLGGEGMALLVAGGLLYTVGAVVYARKRPDPWPTVFGYHEIFHALVVVALILHYCLVMFFVLPAVKP